MSDSRYTIIHYLSQSCSVYQEEVSYPVLTRKSSIERAIELKMDTMMGIIYFSVQPLWYKRGGYNSPERPPETENIPRVDLFKFQGQIYQTPTDGIMTGWSSDKKMSFELHVTDAGKDFIGLIFRREETGEIFKYEATLNSLKKGVYVLN